VKECQKTAGGGDFFDSHCTVDNGSFMIDAVG